MSGGIRVHFAMLLGSVAGLVLAQGCSGRASPNDATLQDAIKARTDVTVVRDDVGDLPADVRRTMRKLIAKGEAKEMEGNILLTKDKYADAVGAFEESAALYRQALGGKKLIEPSAAPHRKATRAKLLAEAAAPAVVRFDLGNSVAMDFVLIRPGTFTMGSNEASDETPHKVTITKPFYLGKYLVTQEQWEAVMGNNPSNYKAPKNPVEMVHWDDCRQFVTKLNEKFHAGGGKFQLPTEAQWEYACRAGSTGKYCFGDNETQLGEYAWYDGNSGDNTHPVGEKKPNAWGLYDMHGNVWEWCNDWYGPYTDAAVVDPTGPAGSYPVIRGGGWLSAAEDCRSAIRAHDGTGNQNGHLGLRVSRVLADKPK